MCGSLRTPFRPTVRFCLPAFPAWIGLLSSVLLAAPPEVDMSKYMSPDEIRPGMTGYGRTVMSGTKIETFNFQVVSVMRNAWYARKDVILIRCSGLNLEHSGIIGGMSGSPCYIKDEAGKERMIGAVAFGWSFNKDPICGVQPITHMLEVFKVRAPENRQPATQAAAASGGSDRERGAPAGSGIPIGEILGRVCGEPIEPTSRFSIFNEDIARVRTAAAQPASPVAEQFRPLAIPLMVGGASPRTLEYLRGRFERFGLELVGSGGAGGQIEADTVHLEPGSVICIPFMTGDLQMEALGTCTEVIGDRVLGFGHSLFGEGSVEYPVATGMVHTVIPSVLRSNKLGAALKTVGTLYGDESSAIFGATGRMPQMVPLEVTVNDAHGERRFHFEVLQDQTMTPQALVAGILESVFANNDLPREFTMTYSLEIEFQELGTFRTSNTTSMGGIYGMLSDVQFPTAALMNAPFGKAKAARSKARITIEDRVRAAMFDEALLSRTVYKPGETVEVRVRWFHYHRQPAFSEASYKIKLPDDLRDGEYQLTMGSAMSHLRALQREKPHWFQAENLSQMLAAFNRMGEFPENRLLLRLNVPRGGLAVKQLELPELPSFRQRILTGSKRTDVREFSEALVEQYETDFVVGGGKSFTINVSRRADQ